MGYQIFILCLHQLRNNFRTAIQLSWFWILISILLLAAGSFLGAEATNGPVDQAEVNILIIPFTVIVVVVLIFAFSAIAIGWHRFVLRDEMPASIFILRREWPIGRYVWTSIKITFAILILITPVLLLILTPILLTFGIAIVSDPTFGIPNFSMTFLALMAIQFVIGVLATWLFLRIGAVLPALTVDQKMTLRDSFRLTKPVSGALVTTAFWVVLLQTIPLLIQLLMTLFISFESLVFIGVTLVVSTIFSFVSFFVGFGILTVVYGHLAENKPL